MELQADAWALQACAFALQTRALRKMHPGKGPVKKGLFLLGWSINETLKEKHMAMEKYSVTVPQAREILAQVTRKAVAELQGAGCAAGTRAEELNASGTRRGDDGEAATSFRTRPRQRSAAV